MGSQISTQTRTLLYSLMKNLVILASFAAAACAMNVAIDKREASMAINSRFRRGSGLGSNIEKECVKKQCKFEEYLESQENQDKAMNRNVRKELKDVNEAATTGTRIYSTSTTLIATLESSRPACTLRHGALARLAIMTSLQ